MVGLKIFEVSNKVDDHCVNKTLVSMPETDGTLFACNFVSMSNNATRQEGHTVAWRSAPSWHMGAVASPHTMHTFTATCISWTMHRVCGMAIFHMTHSPMSGVNTCLSYMLEWYIPLVQTMSTEPPSQTHPLRR
jgi:hypothetical protein